MALSITVLHEHVSRRLGVDVLGPDGEDLLAHLLLDIYSHPYLSPEEAAAMRGHLVVTGLGTAALLAIAGGVFGTFFAFLVGDPASDITRILAGTLGTLPAAWLVGAVCVLAYGLVPRASVPIGWIVWVAVAVLGRAAGPLYGNWGGSPVEPFHHIPNTVARAPFDPAPALVMVALSALLLGAGLLALRRRDVG